MKTVDYGKEAVVDLYNADVAKMNKADIKEFCYQLCKEIDMEAMFYHDWEKEGLSKAEWNENPHLQGVSACLFIKTSSIVVHAIHGLARVYINCFSCKDFDTQKVEDFAIKYFKGEVSAVRDFPRY